MRHLDRASIPVPACLAQRDDGRVYDDLTGAEKAEIRASLLKLQGNRCAYCERRTGEPPKQGHIEHFRKQADHGDLTTTWVNLYWSCSDEDTCGKHKDKCAKTEGRMARFDDNDLLDPGIDEPDQYLLFVEDGSVVSRPGIDAGAQRRADETLRVFRLADSPYLRQQRADALSPYKSAMNFLLPLGGNLLAEYVEGERESILQAPFSTAIRHYFEGIL